MASSKNTGEPLPWAARRVPLDTAAGVPADLKATFATGLVRALQGRSRVCQLSLVPGRDEQEVVVRIAVEGRPTPLPLYFPRAASLEADDVTRIVRNVLEGMGPAAP